MVLEHHWLALFESLEHGVELYVELDAPTESEARWASWGYLNVPGSWRLKELIEC